MSVKDSEEQLFSHPVSHQQVLRVRIKDVLCAIDLRWVERVVPMVALQAVPGAPNYLIGFMDYHGSSILVVDLGLWYSGPQCQDSDAPNLRYFFLKSTVGECA